LQKRSSDSFVYCVNANGKHGYYTYIIIPNGKEKFHFWMKNLRNMMSVGPCIIVITEE